MKKVFVTIMAFSLFTLVQAQDNEWSLSECIDHALSNNIQIKQQELNTEYQENQLAQRRSDRLPNLNAQVSQNFSFGRSENSSGVLVSSNGARTNIGLYSSMVLYGGGEKRSRINSQNYELQSSLEDLKKAKDDITVEIAQAYLEVLFAVELDTVARAQLKQTQLQIERTEILLQAGKVSEGTLLEIKAQAARESLEVVNAGNQHRLALLNLVQILELEDYTGFGVEQPMLPEMQAEHSLLRARDVYAQALDIRPEIKSKEYQLESSNAQLLLSKSGRIPKLSASAGVSDLYVTDYKGSLPGVGDQMNENANAYVGLNLDIPIFNRGTVKNNIKNSEIQIESSRLDLEASKKELRRQIEQAYINALASFERYNANKIAVESMELSFDHMAQKFDLGRVNSVEYSDAKTNLAKAQSDLVQAKYEFIFRSKILDFYNGTPIVL